MAHDPIGSVVLRDSRRSTLSLGWLERCTGGGGALYRNLGGLRFEDRTEQAGLAAAPGTWSAGTSWVDVDGDGLLDLFVCSFGGRDTGFA